ncbi:MAG TPA: hypothetical protein VLF67_02590 [Candidatus Saccharimonas sp.]|nr:hypothetical protein [Candidatus Saccharimonas sp.]
MACIVQPDMIKCLSCHHPPTHERTAYVFKALGGFFVLLGVAAIGFGVYLDIRYMFIGGILEVIHGVKANPTADGEVVAGLARWVFSDIFGFLGLVAFFVLGGIGLTLIGLKKKRTHQARLGR